MYDVQWMRALLACALMGHGLASAVDGQERQFRVLVLSEWDPGTPAGIAFANGLRSDLDPALGYNVYLENFDRFRYPAPQASAEARDWLRARYARTPPDIVVALGEEPIRFLASPEMSPWPGTAVVFAGIDARALEREPAPPSFAGIAQHYAFRETVELALRLFPATRHVALVGGASSADRTFADLARKDLELFSGRLETIDLTELATENLMDRLRGLPEASIILGVTYFRDAAGQQWTGLQIVPRISAAAKGPVFSVHSTVLGHGIVGGVLVDYDDAGRRVARIARRVLAGEDPGRIGVEESGSNETVLDGRQLDRWHVPDRRVPSDAEVRFREPTVWSRYGWVIAAGASALVVQLLLIVGLLVERRRRLQAETRFRENLAVVAHLNRVGAIGEMAGAFAHEINSPLGAVVNNAQAARRFLHAGPDRHGDVAACLDDIVADARRAGEVVRRMRAHLRREDVEPVPVDVAAVIRDAVHLVAMDARDRGVDLSSDVSPELPPLRGDDVQLVQVVLNLLMNALDALREVPGDRRWVRVTAAPVADGVEIQVVDTGPGIPPAQADRIFEPFFTTKKVGLGLGLAISRSIVEAHGGSIRTSPAPAGGTIFRVRLPAALPERQVREAVR